MLHKDHMGPKIPRSHEAGDTVYEVTAKTMYYPKPKPPPRSSKVKAVKSEPLPVKVVNLKDMRPKRG